MRDASARQQNKTGSPAGVVVVNHHLLVEPLKGTDVADGVVSRQPIDYNDTAGRVQVLFDAVPKGIWFEGRVSAVDQIYQVLNSGTVVLTIHEPGENPREITLGNFATVLVPAGVDHSASNHLDQQVHILTVCYER